MIDGSNEQAEGAGGQLHRESEVKKQLDALGLHRWRELERAREIERRGEREREGWSV